MISIFGLRGSRSEKPPIEVFPDMDRQAKYKPQAENAFFEDGRNDRPLPLNTVARGDYLSYEEVFSSENVLNIKNVSSPQRYLQLKNVFSSQILFSSKDVFCSFTKKVVLYGELRRRICFVGLENYFYI